MTIVKLIDVDNKYREKKRRGKRFPNLALMKISAYHKQLGDTVGFETPNADLTYISCVFDKNHGSAIAESSLVKGGISFGGSGINLGYDLPVEIERLKPDYLLYRASPWGDSPMYHTSLGFTTRGCIRNCGYCIVQRKEGKFRRVQHIRDFHESAFKSCTLLDNNIFADKDWFFENTNWAIDHNVQLDITQGMDIRLLTDEIADQLKRIKFVDQQVRFAWDIPFPDTPENADKLRASVESGIAKLKERKFNIRRNVSFYVLCGMKYDNEGNIIQIPMAARDLFRVHALRCMGAMAFVMKYHENDPMLNHLARYTDKREIYRSCTFSEYLETKNPAVTL